MSSQNKLIETLPLLSMDLKHTKAMGLKERPYLYIIYNTKLKIKIGIWSNKSYKVSFLLILYNLCNLDLNQ